MRNYSLSPATPPRRRKSDPRRKASINLSKDQHPSHIKEISVRKKYLNDDHRTASSSRSARRRPVVSPRGGDGSTHHNDHIDKTKKKLFTNFNYNTMIFPWARKFERLAISEAKGVLVWIVASCAFHIILSQLNRMSNSQTNHNGLKNIQQNNSFVARETNVIISAISNGILSLFPRKVLSNESPGFIYSSAWLLLIIRKRLGVMCNVPVRITEMMLGRFTPREIAVIIPIHFVGASLGSIIIKIFMTTIYGSCSLEPINYALNHSWVLDLLREIVVNCGFCVCLLVFPELFKLNHLPQIWLTGLVLYPVYTFSVDSSGKSSALAPNIIYALRCHGEVPITQYPHMIGPILGGLLAGKIMCTLFPDTPHITYY